MAAVLQAQGPALQPSVMEMGEDAMPFSPSLVAATERYARAARDAGCPEDQLRNFLRAGIVLQPRQLDASAAARLCDLPGGPTRIGYGGARGGAKSHWALSQVAADDCQRYAGLKWLYIRKVGRAARESFEDLRRKVLLNLPHEYRRHEGIVIFPNDSRIVLGNFQTESDIDKYLGLEYDGAIIEEATTLTRGKIVDIRTCIRSSKPGWRPREYDTTNPGGVGHVWFKAEFIDPHRRGEDILAGSLTRFIPATVRDNAFINPEYVRTNLESLTGWKKRAWLNGDWDIAAGQFFTTWQHESHVAAPFAIPRGWQTWCSMDYGFTHYTTVYLLAADGDGNLYLVDEHGERGWLPQRHDTAIRSMLARSGVEPWQLSTFVAGADVFAKRGNDGRTIADSYQELGWTLSPANDDRINGAGEILTRLGDVDAGIKPSLFVFDRCQGLIQTLPYLEHDPRRPEDVLKVDVDDDGLGGDDWYDGARYGVMAYAQTRGAPAAGPVRNRPPGFMRI